MSYENTRAGVFGIVCSAIGAIGYYMINPELDKALFVGVIGLVISLTIFLLFAWLGKRND